MRRLPFFLPFLLSAVALLAQPARVYVPNQASNTVSIFDVNLTAGTLTKLADQPTNGNQPYVVARVPGTRFLYVGNLDGTIDAFGVGAGGLLTPVGAPFASAGNVTGIATDPSGAFLYASNDSGAEVRVFSIDQGTGRLTALPGLTVSLGAGASPKGMTADGRGHLYVALAGAGRVAQFSMNATTGMLTAIAPPIAAGSNPSRIAINPAGTYLYVTNVFGPSISSYTIAPTGELTANGPAISTGSPSRPLGIAAHPSGKYVIATYNSTLAVNNVAVYSIGATGTLTLIGTAAAGSLATGVTVDPTGNFVYVSSAGTGTVAAFGFNVCTGALTTIGSIACGSSPQFLQ